MRKLCAVMYQAASAYNMPERFLDALSAAANGEAYDKSFDDPFKLLPCDPPNKDNQ